MRTPLLLALLAAAPVTSGAAQGAPHRLTLEFGDTRFFRGIRDSSSPPVTIHPHRPTLVTARYTAEHFGVALTVGGAATEYRQTDVSLLVAGDVALLELAPELRLPLWRTAAGVELTAHAGPLVSFWKAEGYHATTQLGAAAGASLHLPLAGRFGVGLRLDGGVGGPEVADKELDPGLERSTMWRTRIGLGLSYRLSAPR
jgi:hypothetical protein